MTMHSHQKTPIHASRGGALRLLGAAGALLMACGSAGAVTLSQYGHDLKQDASHAGHAIVRVGADTGHGVVHAAKTVGSDVAHGVKHGYHATRKALSSSHSSSAGKPTGAR